jgi:7,8-dihydropterin-6-yl-methyl-4-(beta-D-ribofuranosyl)aminobenzene 5'-phosphate synthase
MESTQVKITILVDNHAGDDLIAEHGLSVWIEAEGRRILFDTGQGGALAANALSLGVDLGEADALVLSHGHFDHTGGIPHVLKTARCIDTYCHSGAVLPRYSIRNGTPKPIHMPRDCLAAIDSLPWHRLHWVQEPLRLTGKIGLTGPIPRETSFEDTGGPFYLDPEGRRTDAIEDDLALWIRTDKGLVICVGCCHAGVVNTLNHILRLNPDSKIRAVIGGMHLLNASEKRLDRTIAALRSLMPELVVPCHCTGEGSIERMKDALGSRTVSGRAGMTLQL